MANTNENDNTDYNDDECVPVPPLREFVDHVIHGGPEPATYEPAPLPGPADGESYQPTVFELEPLRFTDEQIAKEAADQAESIAALGHGDPPEWHIPSPEEDPWPTSEDQREADEMAGVFERRAATEAELKKILED